MYAWFFNMRKSTVKCVIAEVCSGICEVLGPIFLPFPTAEQFKVIALQFFADLGLVNCFGTLDGRHCAIAKPEHSGSLFFNYSTNTEF